MEPKGSLSELYQMLEDFDTVMLVTMTPDGELRARPMQLQTPLWLADCDLWFVSAVDAPKNEEIEWDEHVNVCCFRHRDRSYVSISAVATIDRNPHEVQRHWKPDWPYWLPNGADSSSAALLKLKIHRAEYWHPEGGRARVLFDRLRGVTTTGEPSRI